jgi:hypothetical protein
MRCADTVEWLERMHDKHASNLASNPRYRNELLALAAALIAAFGRMTPWHAVVAALIAVYVSVYSRGEPDDISPFRRSTEW